MGLQETTRKESVDLSIETIRHTFQLHLRAGQIKPLTLHILQPYQGCGPEMILLSQLLLEDFRFQSR